MRTSIYYYSVYYLQNSGSIPGRASLSRLVVLPIPSSKFERIEVLVLRGARAAVRVPPGRLSRERSLSRQGQAAK